MTIPKSACSRCWFWKRSSATVAEGLVSCRCMSAPDKWTTGGETCGSFRREVRRPEIAP